MDVTKKRGSEKHTAHLLPPTNPCRPCSIDLLHSYKTSNLLTLHLPTGSFLYTPQIEDMQTQQHDQPQAFIFCLSHSHVYQTKRLSYCIHRLCTIPESTSFLDIRRFTKPQLQCCSDFLSFSLSSSSTATTTIWLTTRRSRKSGIQPKSPSYRASWPSHYHTSTSSTSKNPLISQNSS